MAIIYSYPDATNVTSGNKIIGTQTDPTTEENKTVQFTIAQVATFANTSPGYTAYIALLTQTGVNPPVATVLQNTITGTMTWTYSATGQYVLTNTGTPFTLNRTIMFINNGSHGDDNLVGWLPVNTSSVSLTTGNLAGSNANAILTNASIEIRVYA
tara:strand:+ start:25 stop:492 length:468 start_codon:yes stop_codon:yes gene_type:complete